MAQVHVLFVREAEQQMSNSGCCGRLSGDVIAMSETAGERLFCERRAIMEQMGELYRRLDEQFGGQVRLEIVDPRNIIVLTGILWKQWRAQGWPLARMLRTFRRAFHTRAVIVNGEVVAAGTIPAYDQLAQYVKEAIRKAEARR